MIAIDKDWDTKSIVLGGAIVFMSLMVLSSFLPTESSTSRKAGMSNKNENCGVMTADEACINIHKCDYGYGNRIGSLKCFCNGTWKTFGYEDFVERIGKEKK